MPYLGTGLYANMAEVNSGGSDNVLKKAEADIAQYENKDYSGCSSHKKGRFHPYEKSS